MKKYFAELIGTALLVLIGCGTAVFAGDTVGQLGIAIAFGLGITIVAYTFGPISGAHANPAMSIGMLIAGRINFKDFIGYVIFQFIGATIAAGLLFLIVTGKIGGYDVAHLGLGQNGWGEGYGSGFALCAVVLFELIATFIFVRVTLEVTKNPNLYAGAIVGIALLSFHLVGIQIDGTSLNPARSFGPALFAGGQALNQLWVFIVVPLVGGLLAGSAYRFVPWTMDKKSKKAKK